MTLGFAALSAVVVSGMTGVIGENGLLIAGIVLIWVPSGFVAGEKF